MKIYKGNLDLEKIFKKGQKIANKYYNDPIKFALEFKKLFNQ